MTDEDIERTLERYQPAAPSGALRDRILSGAAERATAWPAGVGRLLCGPAFWLAAAALVLPAVSFTIAANRVTARVTAALAFTVSPENSVVDEAARLIGQTPSPEIRQMLLGLPPPRPADRGYAEAPALDPGEGR
jgi:hypothetical protein